MLIYIQTKLDCGDHINKGEKYNEDLGSLADSTIASKLGDKIFDSTTLKTSFLFKILSKNMFNHKNPKTHQCKGSTIYEGEHSYIKSVK